MQNLAMYYAKKMSPTMRKVPKFNYRISVSSFVTHILVRLQSFPITCGRRIL